MKSLRNSVRNSSISSTLEKRGFTLVITLALMVLLTIIAVGLLSLSAVSLRVSTHAAAKAEARANARLALMLAIGELQKQVGPDQRITANSAIVATTPVPNPHWTGVWDSWIAGDLASAPVTSNYPDAASEHQTIGSLPDPKMRPNYQNKSRHFRGWLLSLNPDDVTNIYTPMSLTLQGKKMPQSTDDAVLLVGQGALGDTGPATDFVSARLLNVKPSSNQSGFRSRYGWWVGDESQKAMIMKDSYSDQNSLTMAERLFRQQAPASMGNTSITGLKQMTNESQLSKVTGKGTLDLLDGVVKQDLKLRFHDVTTSSMAVLADVREGGLKRDLSTILERTIDPSEVYNFTYVEEFQRASSLKTEGEEFMLYNFDSMLNSISPTGQACVPIQDLASYYQLYDSYRDDSTREISAGQGGIQYSTNESSPPNGALNKGIMISNPEYGKGSSDFNNYLRRYSAPYRNPAPVKVEVVLNYVTLPRPQVDIDADIAAGNLDPDLYELRIGITPAMTFWNPNNVPLIMNIGDPQFASLFMRETPMPLTISFKKSASYSGAPSQTVNIGMNQVTNTQQGELYTFFLSGRFQAIFEPGESKLFSLQFTSGTSADTGLTQIDFMNRGSNINEDFFPEMELIPGWNPEKFVRPTPGRYKGRARAQDVIMTFKASDYISADINPGNYNTFGFASIQESRQRRNSAPAMYHHRTYQTQSRLNAGNAYKNDFMYLGFPRAGKGGIASTAPRPIKIPAREASKLITAMGDPADLKDDIPQTFFYYGWKSATETHESRNATPPAGGSGRRFPARPFLHSTPMQPPFFDSLTGPSLYNYGWNWFFMPLDNLLDAPISISAKNSGYSGGGYTAENGTTHVVHQVLPLTPPISIAELSNARLGGYSIATEAVAAGYPGLQNPVGTEAYRRVTATGFGGLAPNGTQSVGNSYAHPNIPAGKAFTIWNRIFAEGVSSATPFVDHSYLANKALWDNFFFSSITPQSEKVQMFEASSRTVEKVADDFFFNGKPLPNRRVLPYTARLDTSKLGQILAQKNTYIDGMADKIAAHLMVNGPFNINSTSVEAWKGLFSSLKGKPVAYLDKDTALVGGVSLKQDQPTGVPVGPGGVPNAKSYQNSSPDPSTPEQWIGWRELKDSEIEELAVAMVKQVKLRGPFLSLSEFVNRRLDSSNLELSKMGALQAAIDDPAVSINAGFRATNRKFTLAEKAFAGAVFPEAMEGAIAYGSSAYVDQADILRNMAEQITPRGDTFVIRTYGDALDANGNVLARAWCEAVVQRIPDYIDPANESYVKQSALTSNTNKTFGRKIQIASFRWLDATEI